MSSFRRATTCLWAAASKTGAFLGFVPVWWRGSRARAMPLAPLLLASLCCQLLNAASSVVVMAVMPLHPKAVMVYRSAARLSDAFFYGVRRGELAVLLTCLREYLQKHPLSAGRWRVFFLSTILGVVLFLVNFMIYSYKFLTDHAALSGALHVAGLLSVALRIIAFCCQYSRIVCPLTMLGAAAAELRVAFRLAVQAACEDQRAPDVYTLRALRQRQFLIYDMYRTTSEANGPCMVSLMMDLFVTITPSLGAANGVINGDLVSALLFNGVFLLTVVLIIVMCQWPASEVLYKSQSVLSTLIRA